MSSKGDLLFYSSTVFSIPRKPGFWPYFLLNYNCFFCHSAVFVYLIWLFKDCIHSFLTGYVSLVSHSSFCR